jgi:hypothetical protein
MGYQICHPKNMTHPYKISTSRKPQPLGCCGNKKGAAKAAPQWQPSY